MRGRIHNLHLLPRCHHHHHRLQHLRHPRYYHQEARPSDPSLQHMHPSCHSHHANLHLGSSTHSNGLRRPCRCCRHRRIHALSECTLVGVEGDSLFHL